tara:strand:- start:343 stop:576 length:234 start_codon:yes stop_codon:yes gene_type:complete
MIDNMLVVDLLCERGIVLKDMADVAKDLHDKSTEYDIITDYMIFLTKVTQDSYMVAQAEAAHEDFKCEHSEFPKGVN